MLKLEFAKVTNLVCASQGDQWISLVLCCLFKTDQDTRKWPATFAALRLRQYRSSQLTNLHWPRHLSANQRSIARGCSMWGLSFGCLLWSQRPILMRWGSTHLGPRVSALVGTLLCSSAVSSETRYLCTQKDTRFALGKTGQLRQPPFSYWCHWASNLLFSRSLSRGWVFLWVFWMYPDCRCTDRPALLSPVAVYRFAVRSGGAK